MSPSTSPPSTASFATSTNGTAGWQKFWGKGFISYRRFLLDRLLEQHAKCLQGLVVDVGGKRENKRGAFQPEDANAWVYLNLAGDTGPNAIADAHVLPIRDSVARFCVCTETIEHLREPYRCIQECHRLLETGGALILSVPFLYPIHADPYDFQRYTREGLSQLLRDFSSVEITPMGGAWGVIGMMLEFAAVRLKFRPLRGVLWRVGRSLQWLDESLKTPYAEVFTTGYFVIAKK